MRDLTCNNERGTVVYYLPAGLWRYQVEDGKNSLHASCIFLPVPKFQATCILKTNTSFNL